MKLEELRQQLQTNPDYNKALEDLQLKFDFGNAVLRARLNKNWSQAKLAEAVGTKQANISRIEAGMGNTTFSLAQKIINILDLGCHFFSIEPQPIQYLTASIEISTINAVEETHWGNDNNCVPKYKMDSAPTAIVLGNL
jgi:transcriptional regulator with XRE-family HTH domain